MQEEYNKRKEERNKKKDYKEPKGKKEYYSGGVQYVKKEKPKEEEEEIKDKPKPVAEQKQAKTGISREFCIERLRNEIRDVILEKLKHKNLNELKISATKEQLYSLSRLIDSMPIESISQCEFLLNFGIQLNIKKIISDLIIKHEGKIIDKEEIEALELKDILYVYKYLDMAVQKNQKKFIKLEQADINEDLLVDFKQPLAKTKEPKLPMDYRDALKPKINYEDAKSFPELSAISKEKAKSANTNAPNSIWQQLSNSSITQVYSIAEKPKKVLEEEFPAFPRAKPEVKKEESKVQPVKQIKSPPPTMQEEWPTIQEANVMQPKQEGSKKKKKNKKATKPQPNIEVGFY